MQFKEKISEQYTKNIAPCYVLIKQSDSPSPCQFSKEILWNIDVHTYTNAHMK